MVSVCLPSDALLQHLPSYLGFSYLGRGVSLHGCSSKAQPLLLTLIEGYLLTAAPPDLECGIAPLGPPAPVQPLLFGRGVAPLSRHPWPRPSGSSSQPCLCIIAAEDHKGTRDDFEHCPWNWPDHNVCLNLLWPNTVFLTYETDNPTLIIPSYFLLCNFSIRDILNQFWVKFWLDPGSIPGSRRSPGEGNGNPLQYSCLENPMDREA